MGPVDPMRIEDLPPEAQTPVIVRELFAQSQRLKVLEDHLEGRLRVMQKSLDDLKMWRARMAGFIAAAGAAAGVVADKLLGLFG